MAAWPFASYILFFILTRFCFKTPYSISLFESVRFNVVLLIQFKHMLRERICGHERVCRGVARTSPNSFRCARFGSNPKQYQVRQKDTFKSHVAKTEKGFQTIEWRVDTKTR